MKTFQALKVAMLMMLVVLVSCQKENNDPALESKISTEKGLAGSWEWLRTDGGIAYHIHDTPQSTGMAVTLTFTDDMHYSIVVNDVLKSSGTYTVATDEYWDRLRINYSSEEDHDMLIDHLEGNTLNLSDGLYDGCGSQYKRKEVASQED